MCVVGIQCTPQQRPPPSLSLSDGQIARSSSFCFLEVVFVEQSPRGGFCFWGSVAAAVRDGNGMNGISIGKETETPLKMWPASDRSQTVKLEEKSDSGFAEETGSLCLYTTRLYVLHRAGVQLHGRALPPRRFKFMVLMFFLHNTLRREVDGALAERGEKRLFAVHSIYLLSPRARFLLFCHSGFCCSYLSSFAAVVCCCCSLEKLSLSTHKASASFLLLQGEILEGVKPLLQLQITLLYGPFGSHSDNYERTAARRRQTDR